MPDRNAIQLDSWVVSGGRPHKAGDPLNVPMVTASNFVLGGSFVYSREHGTETVLALEHLLGGMEGGTAIAFASGMAAVAAVFDPLPVGSVVAIPDDCYQGVTSLALEGAQRGRWSLRRLAPEDLDGWTAAVAEADLVWLESPSNPMLWVTDLPAICSMPRKTGNLIAVDNTFATPFGQRPLEFGADIVMHSATKFIGGHSDLLAGVLVTHDDDVATRIRHTRTSTGANLGALESYLAIRGIRTMALRVERAQASAAILAKRLQGHDDVAVVRYPGLPSHPTYDVAKRVLDGFGAMLSFDIHGERQRASAVCVALQLIHHATSLGGVESTMEHRSIVEGQQHLPPTLLRMSVGCENVEDLWSDLVQAIESTR